jgi:hypothetical protein
MVIADRLGKGSIFEQMKDITVGSFIQVFNRRHGLPQAIVSDRGHQLINKFWKHLCQLVGESLRRILQNGRIRI